MLELGEQWLRSQPLEVQAEILAGIEAENSLPDLPHLRKPRMSLAEFCRAAWPIVEPGNEMRWNWHLDIICDKLDAIAHKNSRDTVFNVPPGTSKSLTANVFWPCWIWSWWPEWRGVMMSYGQGLSVRDSLKRRTIVDSPWFRDTFGVRIGSNQNEKMRFENTHGGWMFATSTGGQMTGEHPDGLVCLPHDAMIETSVGSIPIGEIVRTKMAVSVLSYDHETDRAEYQQIEEYETRPGKRLVSISVGESRVECTEDHPVFVVGRGYVAAGSVLVGDRVLIHEVSMRRLRLHVQQGTCSHGKDRKDRKVLLSQVSRRVYQGQQSSSLQSRRIAKMRAVPKGIQGTREEDKDGKILLNAMLRKCSHGKRRETCRKNIGSVPGMRKSTIATAERVASRKMLFSRVCRCGSFAKNETQRKSKIRSWHESRKVSARISPYQRSDSGPRRPSMLGVRTRRGCSWAKTGRASYRLRQDEQCQGKLRKPLSPMSFGTKRKRRSKNEVCERIVLAVEQSLRIPAEVFNIRVRKNHNYFAGGILVHNCDDAMKADEAFSESARQGVLDWYQQTVSTRGVSRGVSRVLIAQRLHNEDLSGFLLKSGRWDHVCLPMRFEPGREDIHPLDPRKEEGELLWPDLFDEERVCDLEASLGLSQTAGQLQQRPPDQLTGVEWPQSYWTNIYAAEHHWPDSFQIGVIAVDPSKGKDAKSGDYSGIVFMGLSGGKLWIDANGERRPAEKIVTDTIDIALNYAHSLHAVAVEVNGFQELLLPEFERQTQARKIMPLPLFSVENRVKKELRIARLGPYFARGGIVVRKNAGGELFVKQASQFSQKPQGGVHDDLIDAAEMALRVLMHLQGIDVESEPEVAGRLAQM